MAPRLGLGAAVARGGASIGVCSRLRVRRAEERVEGHGTVGLLLDIGDVGSNGDSSGFTVGKPGRPQTRGAILQQPPDPPAEGAGIERI